MTPSEAFAAWIDGKRVQVKRHGEWYDVVEFDLTTCGLFVEATNGTRIRGVARTFPFRLADAPTEPKPINTNPDLAIGYRAGREDSEAWGLLRELVGASLEPLTAKSIREHANALTAALGALKKRGML